MLVHAFDSILCVVQNAISATHAGREKILRTPNVPHSAPGAGARSCTRAMAFYAWVK